MNDSEKNLNQTLKHDKSRNPDPITGEPGSHPVGTGIGAAAGGAAAGAAIGTVAGPVGTIAGAAVGAIIGGLAGKGVAEKVNPTVEAAYWRREHSNRAYARGRVYEEFDPAYQVGYENYSELGANGATFEQAEPELRKRYHSKTGSKLKWEEVSPASRAAWNRLAQQQALSNSTKP
jgi:hypothetical protein